MPAELQVRTRQTSRTEFARAAHRAEFRRPILVTVITLLTFAAAGCGAPEAEEHLEHVIPAHKPASYSEGITALDVRGQLYFKNQMSPLEHSQLRDIVDWLPELAADSDLTHREWNIVHSIGSDLKTIVNEVPRPDLAQRWIEHIAALRELIPAADRLAVADEISPSKSASTSGPAKGGQTHD